MLKIERLYSGYSSEHVIKDISFSLKTNEKLCIIGANGSGKSTLLKTLMGLTKSSGIINVLGEDANALSQKRRAKYMALLAQNSSIQFAYSVWDTVALGRYCHRKNYFSTISNKEEELIEDCIRSVGLWKEKESSIANLSGGQLQRVYLARTFAQNPNIILLDEPTNHLDLKVQIELFDYLNNWVKQKNRGIIGVFHDLNSVRNFADKVLLIHKGEVLAYGTVREVLNSNVLKTAYEIDVCEYMKNSYKQWVD